MGLEREKDLRSVDAFAYVAAGGLSAVGLPKHFVQGSPRWRVFVEECLQSNSSLLVEAVCCAPFAETGVQSGCTDVSTYSRKGNL